MGGTQPLNIDTSADERFRSCNDFWVRVELSGEAGSINNPPVQIDDLRIEADLLEPLEKVVNLQALKSRSPQFIWKEDFATNRYLWQANLSHPEHLDWQLGEVSVRMKPGGSHPVLTWKVKSDAEFENVVIRVDCRANHFLSTDHYLVVSLDGETWGHEVSTEAMALKHPASGLIDDGLTLDLREAPEFAGINTFYLRLRPWAGSTVRMEKHRVHPYASGIVHSVEVTANKSR